MTEAGTGPRPWRVVLEHPWTMLVLSALFALVVTARAAPPPQVGDTVTVGDFDYTVTELACGPGPGGEAGQSCPGVVAVTNRSGDQWHPDEVQLWLVSSDGNRYHATEATRAALNRDINPGGVAVVPIEFTPPAGVLFNRVDIVDASGESASIRVLVGEGLTVGASGARVRKGGARCPAR